MDRLNVLYLLCTLLRGRYVLLIDNDGTIRNTNSVKDECLNGFCVAEFGEIRTELLPTQIHRRMHGRPMAEIFVAIADEIYGKTITLDEGQQVTMRLNEYIRPEYVSRPVFEGAKDFLRVIKAMIPVYILTGMEEDLVDEGLKVHDLGRYYDGVLGAPKTKEENIRSIMDQYPGYHLLGIGDAMAEYKAIKAADPKAVFVGVDFENRPKSVFPEEVRVQTSYEGVINEIICQA